MGYKQAGTARVVCVHMIATTILRERPCPKGLDKDAFLFGMMRTVSENISDKEVAAVDFMGRRGADGDEAACMALSIFITQMVSRMADSANEGD